MKLILFFFLFLPSTLFSLYLHSISPPRFLLDGRSCSPVFVQDGKTYTDCTKARSPDGRMTGQEWCYAGLTPSERPLVLNNQGSKVPGESDLTGMPSWGYCKSLLNYDKVREKGRDLVYETIPDIRKVEEVISTGILPCGGTIDLLQKVLEKQGQNDLISSSLEASLEGLERGFANLLGLKSKCEGISNENSLLQKEIAQLKEKNNGETNTNCEGLLGYDEEREGDGLTGDFFDNEAFLGTSIKEFTSAIDFQWLGRSPLPSISSEDFSFKINGFLKVPISGSYRFEASSDSSVSFSLNDQLLLTEDKKDPITNRLSSEEVFLIAGLKYRIEYKGSHSNNQAFHETHEAYSKLSWSSEHFPLQLIPEQYFYQGNKIPPLKLFGYKATDFLLRTMREFDDAFKDSELFKMADIPLQYRGLKQLRSSLHFPYTELILHANSPITVFIAVNERLPNPLPSDFQNTEELLSILKLPKSIRTPGKEIRASLSVPFRVYKKNFPEGLLQIPLAVSQQKKQGISFIFFFQVDSIRAKPLVCGGKEASIGIVNSESFDSCRASSSFPTGQYNCEHGLSGKLIDAPFTMWASNGEGVGAWLEVTFKQEYQIIALEIKNRDNPGERVKELEAKFSNGDSIIIKLRSRDRPSLIKLSPTVTKSLRLTLNSVYGTINNGLSVKIIGLPCKREENGLIAIPKQKTITLRCDHNLINNEFLLKLDLQIGDRFIAFCSSSCVDQSVNIYGSLVYSEDSSICKAAYHMGVIPANGASFSVLISPGQHNYKPVTRNGITSDLKTSSPRSITFEALADVKTKEIGSVFLGMKLDLFDERLNHWVPGSVLRIDNRNKGDCKVLIAKEGFSSSFNENLNWPNPEKLDYCGERLPSRFCDEKSRNPNRPFVYEAFICFTPKPECPSGYLPDSGAGFGPHGRLNYGWSMDISSLTRTRYTNNDILLDNLILFPPDKKSQWCLVEKPKSLCEPVSWSIQVPNGRYNIKITVGDPKNKAGYWVKVNGRSFIEGKILDKNQFFSPSFDIEVAEQRIIVTADCERDCRLVWSRMNAIEIRTAASKLIHELHYYIIITII